MKEEDKNRKTLLAGILAIHFQNLCLQVLSIHITYSSSVEILLLGLR